MCSLLLKLWGNYRSPNKSLFGFKSSKAEYKPVWMMSFEVMEVCVYVLITHLVELLPQQVPLLCVRFAELLFVSDEQREFADWTVQQIFRALFHQLTERLCLWHQHSPGLTDRGRSQWYTSWGHKEKTDKWNSLNVTTWHVGNQLLEPDLLVCSLVGTDFKKCMKSCWTQIQLTGYFILQRLGFESIMRPFTSPGLSPSSPVFSTVFYQNIGY